jgi:hypothetical protein
MILLANFCQGVLAGEARQEHSFRRSLLPALLAKTSDEKETARGHQLQQPSPASKPTG